MSSASPLRPAATRLEVPSPGGSLDRFDFVTDQVKADLERFVGLLSEWHHVHNLIARSALDDVWTRHVADGLQLLPNAPPAFRAWVDLGSGAGFPGLVVAIASKAVSDRHFTLVESNAKKAAFLRAAIRETSANASVANERLEAHAQKMTGQADVISARALAPLPDLLKLAMPYAHGDTLMLFPKGKEHVQERKAASQSFDFDVIEYASATDSGGRVLAIRNVSPKART